MSCCAPVVRVSATHRMRCQNAVCTCLEAGAPEVYGCWHRGFYPGSSPKLCCPAGRAPAIATIAPKHKDLIAAFGGRVVRAGSRALAVWLDLRPALLHQVQHPEVIVSGAVIDAAKDEHLALIQLHSTWEHSETAYIAPSSLWQLLQNE